MNKTDFESDFNSGTPWAIMPERLHDAMKISFGFGKDEKKAQANEERYTLAGSVAVIPISGPIMRGKSFDGWFMSWTGHDSLVESLTAADEDPQVSAIVLSIDSPGGVASGTDRVAAAVAGMKKPVVAWSDGYMASAAYWIGSAADKVMLGNTGEAGSIGVVMCHYDFSEADRIEGIKRTYLTAGSKKAYGNSAEPLSTEARAEFQTGLDYIHKLFVADVATHRGKPEADIWPVANGGLFIGAQAVEAGLADDIGSLDDAVRLALSLADSKTNSTGERIMKIESIAQLEAEHPDLIKQIREQAAASVDTAPARSESALAERDRILGLAAVQFGPDAAAKFTAIVSSGVSVEQMQAIAALNPPKAEVAPVNKEAEALVAQKQEMLAALQASGAQNPGAGANSSTPGTEEERFEANQELKTEFGTFARYQAFLQAEKAGKVKILRRKEG